MTCSYPLLVQSRFKFLLTRQILRKLKRNTFEVLEVTISRLGILTAQKNVISTVTTYVFLHQRCVPSPISWDVSLVVASVNVTNEEILSNYLRTYVTHTSFLCKVNYFNA